MHVLCLLLLFFSQGGDDTLLATQVLGNFFVAPGSSLSLQFLPNAGIRLHNVAVADAGTYSVHVNMNVHGSVVEGVQTVEVQVSGQPITTDGQLHVTMLPDAVYVNSTRHYHVQLACGDFLPVWGHRASVLWKTPNNQTLSSTSDENGRFLLSVPNPVVSGEYSCVIDDTSPASLCVPSGSPLRRGATVNVDGVQAQFVIMEARMMSMQLKEEQLEQENAALKQQLETQRRNLTSMIGGAYSSSTGVFTVPVDGTYAFFATITPAGTSPEKNPMAALYADNTELARTISSPCNPGFSVDLSRQSA
nr:hypothetical protein BaRGS_034228 [Batillaria attramentaria]